MPSIVELICLVAVGIAGIATFSMLVMLWREGTNAPAYKSDFRKKYVDGIRWTYIRRYRRKAGKD